MSHHASGPNFGFPRGDARLDMTDLYAFPKPGDPARSILIFNVHPSFDVNPPVPTTTEPSRRARYTKSRSTRMAMPLPISVTASGSRLPKMGSRLRRFAVFEGREPPARRRGRHHRRASTGLGRSGCAGAEAGDYRVFFGWRSDPFFFDADGLFNNMQFTGDDFFADKDVCSIVLELPNSALGTNEVGIWARTLDGMAKAGSRQTAVDDPCKRSFSPGRKGGIPQRGTSG